MASKPAAPADRGFRVGISEAAAIATRESSGHPTSARDDYVEKIGRSFLDRLMERAADGVIPGTSGPGGAGAYQELAAMAEALDKIRGKPSGNRSRRPRTRVIRVDGGRRGGASEDRVILSVVEKMSEAIAVNSRETREMVADMLDRLEKHITPNGKGKTGETSEVEKLAFDALREKISGGDPIQTALGILNAGKQFKEALGVTEGSSPEDDLDRYVARQRMNLESLKVQAEIEDMREQREQRGGFIAALPALVGSRRRGGSAQNEDAQALYRYRCAACNHKWRSHDKPEPGAVITCPSCEAQLQINAVGGKEDGGEEDAG